MEAETSHIPDQEEKRKKSSSRRRGCVVLLLIILLLPSLCYGSMWLFALVGGEWATSSDLPLPPNSRFLGSTYEDGYAYRSKNSLYANQSTPEELREWFVQENIFMSPIPLNLEKTRFIEYDHYFGTASPFHRSSFLQQLHSSAAFLTHGWFDEMAPDCQQVRVYKDATFAAQDFPDIDISNATSVILLTTCWLFR